MNAGASGEPQILAILNTAVTTAARHVRTGLWVGGIAGASIGIVLALIGAVVRGACVNAPVLAVFGVVVLALGGALHGALAGALGGMVTAALLVTGTLLRGAPVQRSREQSGSMNQALFQEAAES
jgi:hypothetical protein